MSYETVKVGQYMYFTVYEVDKNDMEVYDCFFKQGDNKIAQLAWNKDGNNYNIYFTTSCFLIFGALEEIYNFIKSLNERR